jgi:hypothetical protein
MGGMHGDTDSAGHQGGGSGSSGRASWRLIKDNMEDLSGSKMRALNDRIARGIVGSAVFRFDTSSA